MSDIKPLKTYTTLSFFASHRNFEKPLCVRVCFEVYDSFNVKVYAVAGKGLGSISSVGAREISYIEFLDTKADEVPPEVFARRAAGLLNLKVVTNPIR